MNEDLERATGSLVNHNLKLRQTHVKWPDFFFVPKLLDELSSRTPSAILLPSTKSSRQRKGKADVAVDGATDSSVRRASVT